MSRSTSHHIDPRSPHGLGDTPTADVLVEELGVVTTWPQMAAHFSKAIATIKSHERSRVVMLTRLAERDKRIGTLREEMDALVTQLQHPDDTAVAS